MLQFALVIVHKALWKKKSDKTYELSNNEKIGNYCLT